MGAVNARTLIALETFRRRTRRLRAAACTRLTVSASKFATANSFASSVRQDAAKALCLRLLAGLDSCEQGHLAMDGEPILGPSPRVGVVFQAANLLPWLSVRENVRLPLRVGGRHAPSRSQG